MRWRSSAGLVALVSVLAVGSVALAQIEQGATATRTAERVQPPPPQVPPEAQPVDTSNPDIVIGNGTPASCTSASVVNAVAAGGVITFDCGPSPVVIQMQATAKVVNTSRVVVLDGGGLVTLSGGDQRRIFYMNTCDQTQLFTTPHCQNQDHPNLTLQGLHFTQGNSTGETIEGGGGGAVFVRGGRVKVVDSTFSNNRCDPVGPDVGGAGLRVLSQYEGLPVIVSRSSFVDNVCSNGGGTSSIGVSWRFYETTFSGNRAIGNGANPAQPGTPGGGNGGAIYLDGNEMTLELFDTMITDNVANEGGGAIFFVSNNRTGQVFITDSALSGNPSLGFETRGYPGIFFLGRGQPNVVNSTLTP